jgi:uncharacterized protein with PQ loop repeat
MNIMIDVLFALGTCSFVIASLRQVIRIRKTKDTNGLSLTKYHIKIFAIGCMLLGYILSTLPISIIISSTEMILNFISIYLITKYRKIPIWSY